MRNVILSSLIVFLFLTPLTSKCFSEDLTEIEQTKQNIASLIDAGDYQSADVDIFIFESSANFINCTSTNSDADLWVDPYGGGVLDSNHDAVYFLGSPDPSFSGCDANFNNAISSSSINHIF